MTYDVLEIKWERLRNDSGLNHSFDTLFLYDEELLGQDDLDTIPANSVIYSLTPVSYGSVLQYEIEEVGLSEVLGMCTDSLRKYFNFINVNLSILNLRKNIGESGTVRLVFEYDLIKDACPPDDHPPEFDSHFEFVGFLDTIVDSLKEFEKVSKGVLWEK